MCQSFLVSPHFASMSRRSAWLSEPARYRIGVIFHSNSQLICVGGPRIRCASTLNKKFIILLNKTRFVLWIVASHQFDDTLPYRQSSECPATTVAIKLFSIIPQKPLVANLNELSSLVKGWERGRRERRYEME